MVGVLVFLSIFVGACASSEGEALEVGDQAPDFTALTASGEQVSLGDYRGEQPVLLFFHMAVG